MVNLYDEDEIYQRNRSLVGIPGLIWGTFVTYGGCIYVVRLKFAMPTFVAAIEKSVAASHGGSARGRAGEL